VNALEQLSFQPLLTLAEGAGERGPAPLFCVHPAAGVGWEYAALVPYLAEDRGLYALQARGFGDPDALPGSVEEIAEDYVRLIREVRAAGPYHLLGWSFGGAVVHAMATRLRARGETVGLLAILDWYPFDPARPQDEPSEHEYLLTLLENLGCDPGRVREQAAWPLDPDGALNVLLRRGHVLDFLDDARLEALLRVFLHHVRLRTTHVPELFDGDLQLFRAAAEPCATESLAAARSAAAWRPFVGGAVEEHDIDSLHRRMMQRAPAAEIGPLLAQALLRTDYEGQT
jgi:nonribosomal peptide synthetase DhbF